MAGQNPEAWLAARRAAGKPDEQWADIPGWPYQVSDQGRVRNTRGRIISQRPNGRPKGAPPERQYPQSDLWKDGERVTFTVHSVELTAFDDLRPDGCEARHLNDVPSHNWWPENLAWGTPDQNAADKARQAGYHTDAAKARRSDASRRGRAKQLADIAALRERDRANTPSRNEERRMWRKVTATFRDFLTRHRRPPITPGQRPPITEGDPRDANTERAAEPPVLLPRAPCRKPVTEGDRLAEIGHDGE